MFVVHSIGSDHPPVPFERRDEADTFALDEVTNGEADRVDILEVDANSS